MEEERRTLTFGDNRLKIEADPNSLWQHGVEVKAKVDMTSGEVKFYVDKKDLEKLK